MEALNTVIEWVGEYRAAGIFVSLAGVHFRRRISGGYRPSYLNQGQSSTNGLENPLEATGVVGGDVAVLTPRLTA